MTLFSHHRVRHYATLILLACLLISLVSAVDLPESKTTAEKTEIKALAITKDATIAEIVTKDTTVSKDSRDATKGSITINIQKIWYENSKVCVKYSAYDKDGEYAVINPTCIQNPPIMVQTGTKNAAEGIPVEEQDLRILTENLKDALLEVLTQNALSRPRGKAINDGKDPTLIVFAEHDGRMARFSNSSGETFESLRNSTGNSLITTRMYFGYQDYEAAGNYAVMARSATTFNTTSLLPVYTVNSAKVSLMGGGRYDVNTTIVIVSFTPANKLSYAATDYNIASWGTTALANNFSYSDWTNSVYHNFTLYDTSNVVKGGYTTLGYRSGYDIDNTHNTFYSNNSIHALYTYSISTNGTSSDPFITIDYTEGDTAPPESITNLTNTTTCNSINWTWMNPADADFNHTMIYQNGVFLKNVTNSTAFDLWSSLAELTDYTFSSHTVDITGNVNSTWVNLSSTTASCSTPTPSPTQTSLPDSSGSDSGEYGRPTSFVIMSPGVTSGQTMTFVIDESLTAGSVNYTYAIIAVEIVPSQTLGATELIVTDVTTTDTSQFSGRSTAGIVRIELLGVNPSLISKGSITFTVAGSWLMQHGLTSDDIVVMRNSGGKWSEIPTTFVNQNKDMYSFTATTPGFSNFAITSRVNATTENTTIVNAVEPTGSEVISSSTVAVTTPSTFSADETLPSNTTRAAIPLPQPPATQSPLSLNGVILVLFILFIARQTGKL
jgi:PGF-pre-PGF domain-containing protein